MIPHCALCAFAVNLFSGEVMTPWFKNVIPHQDVRDGVLDESVFAADLSEVALGSGRAVYARPELFFTKTFFTAGLRTICKRVIDGLNGKIDSGDRIISLQTGFGGGKTHSLIALYHLAKTGRDITRIDNVEELLKYTGPVTFENGKVAVFTNKTCDPTMGRKADGITIKTIWGEIAWQLGGKAAYELIRENDEKQTCPKGIFKNVLTKYAPALILIDELADYCVSASAVIVGKSTLCDQTISFVQELSEAVASVPNSVLVATLPASPVEVASSQLGTHILTSLSNRLSRVSADTKPVNDEEIFEVLRRRLFETTGDSKVVDEVATNYEALYQSLALELPSFATKSEYRERIRKSYPFHPGLIEVFHKHWASHHDFQRTRGVLRLLASIVSDLWQRQNSLVGDVSLIHTSDVNLANLDTLTSQIKKLWGNGYDAVIPADISGKSSNAFKIDSSVKEYGAYNIAQGIASTVLLYSFGSTGGNKGFSIEDIKLSVVRPLGFNHNSVNGALDRLEAAAHYLYYSSTGSSKRYWFHTKPNINILINQAKGDIKLGEVYQEILSRLTAGTQTIAGFNVLVAPSDEVPEQKSPTLIVMHPKYQINGGDITAKPAGELIKKLATKKGNGDRVYRNTLLFLLCSEVGFTKLYSDIQEYLACVKIRDDYQGQLEQEQKADIKMKIDSHNQSIDRSIASAYTVIAKHCSQKGIETLTIKQFKDQIDRQITTVIQNVLVEEEWLLQKIGLSELKKQNLLPAQDAPIRAKDVFEAFLRYDDKPMVTNAIAVQDSLARFCSEGHFGIASGEPNKFSRYFFKEQVPFFDVTETTYWLVDKTQIPVVTPDASPSDESTGAGSTPETVKEENGDEIAKDTQIVVKSYKAITISGKVAPENYSQIFSSFVQPLINNKIEIKIEIKGKATEASPINENTMNYKITKESASQLGLTFTPEE